MNTGTPSTAGVTFGLQSPAFIIAELSGNHNGSFERAMKLVELAKQSGADAVKLQTYTPDTITIRSDRKEFVVQGGQWGGKTLYELYEEAHTPWEWQSELKSYADSINLPLFSTPFDETSVEFLESLDVPAYKIASFEIIDVPLIRLAARTGKPLIMSTGMASLNEITEAVEAARDAGAEQIALLCCTSAYPAPPEEANLLRIPDLARRFDVISGLSDHTLDNTVPIVAVSLGAKVIEKHLTLDRSEGGVDSSFSLEPQEFRAMVDAVRTAEKTLGDGQFQPSSAEASSTIFRRSIYCVKDIVKGEIISKENVRSIRPGYGIPPKYLDEVIGSRATSDLPFGTPIQHSHYEPA